MICIFLDSNILYSKSSDFTKARFVEKLDELIGEIEVNDIYTHFRIMIPQIVVSELYKQQIDDCTEAVQKLRRIKVTEQAIDLPSNYEEICNDIFGAALKALKSAVVTVEVVPYPPPEALERLIQRVINKNPPFEGKEKQSDKGFKDAIFWETVLEYKRNNPQNGIVLYSKDARLTDSFLSREFHREFNEPIHLVRREDTNSHRGLIQKLCELVDTSVQSETFLQQLKDRLVDLLNNIPDEYIMDLPREVQDGGERLTINRFFIGGIDFVNETEHSQSRFIEFTLNVHISYSYAGKDGGGDIDMENEVTINYSLDDDNFYLKCIHEPDGTSVFYEDLGLKIELD